MNYQHGDWYCKPKTEAEAKEILERAVASGAELCESVGPKPYKTQYPWNFCSAWGVLSGKTLTGDTEFLSSSYGALEYTIEQVRQKFPLPDVRKEKAPIYTHEYNDRGVYKLCTVVVGEPDTLDRVLVENQYGEYDLAFQSDLRPLRS